MGSGQKSVWEEDFERAEADKLRRFKAKKPADMVADIDRLLNCLILLKPEQLNLTRKQHDTLEEIEQIVMRMRK